MLRMLNQLSGAVVGGIFYPIKYLIIRALLFAAALVITPFLLLIIPVAFFAASYAASENLLTAILFTLFMTLATLLITVVVAPIAIALGLFYDIVKIVVETFQYFFRGIIEGYNEGLFFHVTNRLIFDITYFSPGIQKFLSIVDAASQAETADLGSFEFWFENLTSVETKLTNEEFQNLHFEPAITNEYTPLSQEEIAHAEDNPRLEGLMSRYTSLLEKLNQLDRTLQSKNSEDLGEDQFYDELNPLTKIDNPMLLAQYYLNSSEVLSCSTFITCDTNLKGWLSVQNTHPLTREKILTPNDHLGRQTCYRLNPYRTHGDCLELVQLTDKIRNTLGSRHTLDGEPTQRAPAAPFSGQLNSTFHGGRVSTAVNDETDLDTSPSAIKLPS